MTFTADDSTVVKVSKAGTVTGLKTGSTTVTVTSDTDDSVYATVNLDVKSSYTASQLRYMSSIITVKHVENHMPERKLLVL